MSNSNLMHSLVEHEKLKNCGATTHGFAYFNHILNNDNVWYINAAVFWAAFVFQTKHML